MKKTLQYLTLALIATGCTQYATENGSTSIPIREEITLSKESASSDYEEIYIYKTPYTETTELKEKTNKPLFNLERSHRCVVDFKNKDVITTIPFKHEAFDVYRLNSGDALPRYEVTEYSFTNEPADKVFKDLLAETDIKVVAIDQYYPEISGDKITGELVNVMDSIADASDIYYTYNEKRKTLYLSRHDQIAFKVPNKDLILSVLDALQGGGIEDISIDWEDNTLIFESDKLQEKRAKKLIELFEKEPKLAFYDVTVYHIEPTGSNQIDWSSLIDLYGTNNIKSGEQGTVGKILVTSHVVNQKSLVGLLSAQANVYQVAQGEFSVPNNWRSRFDVWNCGNLDLTASKFSILAQTSINDNKISSKLAVDTVNGEVSSFDVMNRLDENIVIFGLSSKSLGYSDTGETIVLLTPKIVDVIKEN